MRILIPSLLYYFIAISASMASSVNWSTFLQKHDLTWEAMPQAWQDAPFTGNGMLGSLFFQLDDHTVRISLGRSDVEDHQKTTGAFLGQARLPNGYFTLKTKGKITGFTGRLDLYNALVTGEIQTESGSINVKSITHSNDMIIAYEFTPNGNESADDISFVPLKAIAPARFQAEEEVKRLGDKTHSSRQNWAKAPYTYNDPPVIESIDNYSVSRQDLKAGGQTGTAWSITQAANSTLLLCSIEHSYPEQTAVQDAITHLQGASGKSFQDLFSTHTEWWHEYYPQSFISLDDTKMEGFYWIQVYKFGAGARKGRAFMDTMGPWITENTAWANGWFNLNTQLSYWFLSTANRNEIGESLYQKLDDNLDTLISNMPATYEGKAAGISTITPQTFISPVPNHSGFYGELLWTCHDYWLMLERTMDHERTKTKFFTLLKKSVNRFLHDMVEGDDGLIHLPNTRSPEYGGGEDCNFNLALFKWGCDTLIHINDRYQLNDPLLPQWQDVVKRLVPYPTNENGYMVAKDFPFEQSHRHYSHLMMIYPLCEINIDQKENRELMETSIDHWINYPGSGNAGYSWSGVAAMQALLANGKKAADYLDIFMNMQVLYPNNPADIHCTTMYTETGRIQPVTETPFSLCDSMQLMLLQSWGDTIRIFPAVPDSWANLSFEGLLAKGAFSINASRRQSKTEFVTITSNAGEPCQILIDFEIAKIEGIAPEMVTPLGHNKYKIDLKKGESVTLYNKGIETAQIRPVDSNEAFHNHFGLKK